MAVQQACTTAGCDSGLGEYAKQQVQSYLDTGRTPKEDDLPDAYRLASTQAKIAYNGPKDKFNLKEARMVKEAGWECSQCGHKSNAPAAERPGLCTHCNSQEFTWVEEDRTATAQTESFGHWECLMCPEDNPHKFSPEYKTKPTICPMCSNQIPDYFIWIPEGPEAIISSDEVSKLSPIKIAELIVRRIHAAKDKAEDFEVNPWAVCTESIGKTEGTTERSEWSEDAKERYERCVKKVKTKSKK